MEHCKPCEGGVRPLNEKEILARLSFLKGWKVQDGKITKTYSFKNYYETIAFVNATAWISNQENHHPDLVVLYNECQVSYITHAIDGLSVNDFICADQIDMLFSSNPPPK